jgi:hypothetical protein
MRRMKRVEKMKEGGSGGGGVPLGQFLPHKKKNKTDRWMDGMGIWDGNEWQSNSNASTADGDNECRNMPNSIEPKIGLGTFDQIKPVF